MRDIERLMAAFAAVGIETFVKDNGDYQYLFVGERRDLYSMDGSRFRGWEEDDLDTLLLRHKWFEFEDGNLVSYPYF